MDDSEARRRKQIAEYLLVDADANADADAKAKAKAKASTDRAALRSTEYPQS
jgi:hypothetical protein